MIKNYKPENIRNITIIGHNNTGKTTLTEALLYMGGAVSTQGSVENKNTKSDYLEEEKKRAISIHDSVLYLEHDDVKVNIIDTPGLSDFVGDVRASLRVTEGAIVMVDSVDGVEIETEKIWRYANEYHIPRLLFVNKMDKEKADFFKVLRQVQDKFGKSVIAIEIPIGKEDNFEGVIDLTRMKAVYYKDKGKGVDVKDIPEDMLEIAKEYRSKLAEVVAESDDKLIEKFLNEEPLTEEEIEKGLKESIKSFKIVPVVCGSALKDIGVMTLLRMIVHDAPSPVFSGAVVGTLPGNEDELVERQTKISEPLCGFIFKTTQDQYSGKMSYIRIRSGVLNAGDEIATSSSSEKEKVQHIYYINGKEITETDKLIAGDIGVLLKLEKAGTGDSIFDPAHPIVLPKLRLPKPVYSLAIEAESKNNEEKLFEILERYVEEDPTIKLEYNKETKESILSGMGDFQLRLVMESIANKYKIKMKSRLPKIAYRETIRKSAEARYKHKKQSGGHGQYGEVHIKIVPKERGSGYEFFDEIVGGVIPKNYIPGVEKGIKEAMKEGVLAKFPVKDLEVHLFDGSFHAVDSSEYSFKVAASYAFKDAMKKADPAFLEPIMKVSVQAESDLIGDILGDLNGRRGRVLGMEEKKKSQSGAASTTIEAHVPYSELLTYALDLKSKSSGKASFEMEFSHYDILPDRLKDNVLKQVKEE